MSEKRLARLNSLLKEVISDVVHHQLNNPKMPRFVTIVNVEISQDLRHARVFVSVMGSDKEKKEAMAILDRAKGFIALKSSKEVVMRYFPELRFILDEGMEHQEKIDTLLKKVVEEREKREG